MNTSPPQLVKRTYWIDDEILERFEALVPPEKRDEVMNQIIQKWLEDNPSVSAAEDEILNSS